MIILNLFSLMSYFAILLLNASLKASHNLYLGRKKKKRPNITQKIFLLTNNLNFLRKIPF